MWRHERKTTRAFRKAPFPLYGLPESWAGLRMLGGRGWTKGIGTSRLSLAHRSHAGRDASQVIVDVLRERGLLNHHKAEIEEWVGLRKDFEAEPIRDSEWVSVQIPVAGQDLDFEMIRGVGDRWGALASRGDLMVKVQAHHFPVDELSLVEVTDIEPYLSGHDEYMRAIRSERSS